MEIFEEKQEDAVIFKITGRLDSTNSSEVEEKILSSIANGIKNVILDFSSLEYISSAGIRVLVQCYKQIEKKQGHVCLASVPKPIENVLYITGFLHYFNVFEGIPEALSSLKK